MGPNNAGKTQGLIRPEHLILFGWAVILVAIGFRVGWSAWVAHAHPEAATSGDTPSYIGPARALVDQGHFSLSPHDATPMFLRTPGYPAFLAAILWVTNSQWSISPIQAALSLVTVTVTVLIARRILGPPAGLMAGVFVALDPLQFALSGTILSESLASLLLVSVVAAGVPVFVRAPERVQARYVFALGALIAAATMVRPTTYYFPVIVLVLLAVRFWHLPRRSILVLLLAFVMPSVAVVGGWQVRNHYAVNSWQVAGTQAVTLYCWHAAEVEARATGQGMTAARERLGCHPGGWDDLTKVCPSWWPCDTRHPLAYGPGFDEMSRRAIVILRQHPVQTAEVMARGLVREVAGPGTGTVGRFLHTRSSPALTVLLLLWNVLLWSLALVGAVVGLRSPLRRFWVFVISVLVYVVVVSAGAQAGPRFRTPLVPLVALLAALGARQIVTKLRQPMSPSSEPA